MEICYSPIGIIHSEYTDQDKTPIQGIFSDSEGYIEIYPEFRSGLKDMEGFSHLILIYHFHRAQKWTSFCRPFVDQNSERGIFAIRHFNRPNPIGLSIVDFVSVEENGLKIKGVDVLDGTPLLDIKPYVAQFDHRDNVKSGWVDSQDMQRVRDTGASPGGLKKNR